jgi:mRNA interferase RelE/StbE
VAKYTVDIKPSARKEMERLSDRLIARLLPQIEGLSADPRRPGCQKLRGYKDLWRIRTGDYRVVYIVDAAGLPFLIRRHFLERRLGPVCESPTSRSCGFHGTRAFGANLSIADFSPI